MLKKEPSENVTFLLSPLNILFLLSFASIMCLSGCNPCDTDPAAIGVAPPDVEDLSAVVEDKMITLQWANPINALFDHVVIYYGSSGNTDIYYTGTVYPTGTTVDMLSNETEYTFLVRSIGLDDSKSNGVIVRATPTDLTPPGEVSSLTTQSGDDSVTLNWENPSDTDFDHCELWCGRSGAADNLYSNNVLSTNVTISGIGDGYEYTFLIKSVDDKGNKSAGLSVTATGLPAGMEIMITDTEEHSDMDTSGTPWVNTAALAVVSIDRLIEALDAGNDITIATDNQADEILLVANSVDLSAIGTNRILTLTADSKIIISTPMADENVINYASGNVDLVMNSGGEIHLNAEITTNKLSLSPTGQAQVNRAVTLVEGMIFNGGNFTLNDQITSLNGAVNIDCGDLNINADLISEDFPVTITSGDLVTMAGGAKLTAGAAVNISAGNTVTISTIETTMDNPITVASTGDIVAGIINAGQQADVDLNAQGGIIMDAGGKITAETLTADAAGAMSLYTSVSFIDASTSAAGNLVITETDDVELIDVDTTGGAVIVEAGGVLTATDAQAAGGDLTLDAGSMTLGAVSAAGNTVTLVADTNIEDGTFSGDDGVINAGTIGLSIIPTADVPTITMTLHDQIGGRSGELNRGTALINRPPEENISSVGSVKIGAWDYPGD